MNSNRVKLVFVYNPYSNDRCFKQNFSFSDPIIRYMAKNPSTGKCYQKLVKSCKYFYKKNPMIVISCLKYSTFEGKKEWTYDVLQCSNENCRDSNIRTLDFEKLKGKIWLINSSKILCWANENTASLMASKVFHCNLYRLALDEQRLTFSEFKLLTNSIVVDLTLQRTIVKFNDGTVVQMEQLVESCPKLKTFVYRCNSYTPEFSKSSISNLMKIEHVKLFSVLWFFDLPELDDFKSFILFLKENEDISCWFTFDNVSRGYVTNIRSIINECGYNERALG